MKKLSTLFILGLIILGSEKTANAQQDLLLYGMDAVPQHMYNNPASRPSTRLNIGLPGLSSIYLRHENTIYNPFHLFEQRGSNSALRTEHFLNQTRKVNSLGYDLAVDLLSVGFAVGEKDYFSFSIRERVQGRWSIPGDMVRFPFTGNASFDELEDGTLDFSDFRVSLNHYREMGFGWQRDLNDKWNVGGRLKLLYGYENIDTKTSTMTWKTDEETYDWTFAGELDVYSSGLSMLGDSLDENSDIESGEIADYLLKRKNYGLGIDLGAEYQVNEKLSVNASLSDLGYIKWKTYNQNLNTDNGEFMFTGLEISEQTAFYDGDVSDTLDVLVEDLLDDLEASFAVTDNEEAYRSALLARVHIGANYALYASENTSGSAGALIQSEFYKGRLRPTFGISYQQKVGRWLTAQLGYTVIDRNFRNLGLGLSMNAGPVQWYVTTDNLLAGVLDRMVVDDEASTSDGSFVYSSYARTMQVHTGINLTFGRKPNDRDGDGIIDKKDACPDTPGLAEFAGCPDTDGDGIEDKLDICPDTPGLKEFAGCPDRDGDGIEDRSDACPDTPGLAQFEGCPDTDEDGIQDSEDACPETPGLEQFKGCPDTDGDGLQDSEDECPNTPGYVKYMGCPDTDLDGIRDIDDGCPEEAGPFENNGCPWGDMDGDTVLDKDDGCPQQAGPVENGGCPWPDTDGDTVLDKDDACPLTPGTVENRGCPVIEEEEQEILNTAFENLEFVSGKAVIKEESKPSMIELADLLIKKDAWKLQIAGHTDDVGAAATNMELSKKRSNAVADFIESQGVARDRMIIQWFGETKPVGDNKTAEGRQMNRRVEMTVVFD